MINGVVKIGLAGECVNTNEQRSLKEASAKAKKVAGLLRAQIAIFIASAQGNRSRFRVNGMVLEKSIFP